MVVTSKIVDLKLLEVLVCSITKQPLVYNKEQAELVSNTTGLAFPIIDGIPVMLIEEAREIKS